MARENGFERVYRESIFFRLLLFVGIPFEMGVFLLGALVLVSVPIMLFAGETPVAWTEALGTVAAAATFTWWGGSASYALWVDLLRGVKTFEGKVDEVDWRSRGLWDFPRYWVVTVAGRSFWMRVPPPELRVAVRPGVEVRILEAKGTGTIREVWVATTAPQRSGR